MALSHVRIDPLVSAARYYENEIDDSIPLCDVKEPYYKISIIQHIDNGYNRISCAVVPPNKRERAELSRKLKEFFGGLTAGWRHKKREITRIL